MIETLGFIGLLGILLLLGGLAVIAVADPVVAVGIGLVLVGLGLLVKRGADQLMAMFGMR